eukprot:GEMP01012154.1.p1 GENE.GEMP01012154.1~~GEMP01012154.1.p1  ORF type:complete len:644 (+),score=124.71 GEMP01012154.1:249-2180(+)
MRRRLNWDIPQPVPDANSNSSSNVSLPPTVRLPTAPAILACCPHINVGSSLPEFREPPRESQSPTQGFARDMQLCAPTSQSGSCSPAFVVPHECQGPESEEPIQAEYRAHCPQRLSQKEQNMPTIGTHAWGTSVLTLFEPRRKSAPQDTPDPLEGTLTSTKEDAKDPTAPSSSTSALSLVQEPTSSCASAPQGSPPLPSQASFRCLDPIENLLRNNCLTLRRPTAPPPTPVEDNNAPLLGNDMTAVSFCRWQTGNIPHCSVPLLSLSYLQGVPEQGVPVHGVPVQGVPVTSSLTRIVCGTDVFVGAASCCFCKRKFTDQDAKIHHEKICENSSETTRTQYSRMSLTRQITSPHIGLQTPVLESRRIHGPVGSAGPISTRRRRGLQTQTRTEITSARPAAQPARTAKSLLDPPRGPRFGTCTPAKPLFSVPNPPLNRPNSPQDVTLRLLAHWRAAGLIQHVTAREDTEIVERALGKSAMVPLAVWKIADAYGGQLRLDEQCYEMLKHHMMRRDGEANEMMLWHGTRWNAVLNVIKGGFNRSYATQRSGKKSFGIATYFTPKVDFANIYADKDANLKGILLAKVLVGRACRGSVDDREPPVRTDGKWHFDSTFDEAHNTTRIAIFKDYQAVPLYLVVFGSTREKT